MGMILNKLKLPPNLKTALWDWPEKVLKFKLQFESPVCIIAF